MNTNHAGHYIVEVRTRDCFGRPVWYRYPEHPGYADLVQARDAVRKLHRYWHGAILATRIVYPRTED